MLMGNAAIDFPRSRVLIVYVQLGETCSSTTTRHSPSDKGSQPHYASTIWHWQNSRVRYCHPAKGERYRSPFPSASQLKSIFSLLTLAKHIRQRDPGTYSRTDARAGPANSESGPCYRPIHEC